MSQTVSASPLPFPQNSQNHSASSLKEWSQEVIEEKQNIIEQIYKQLKASLTTNNVLTQEVENLKAQIQEVDLSKLKEEGFIRKENGRSIIVVDLTKAFEESRQIVKLDTAAEIVYEENDNSVLEKLQYLEAGYKQALKQSETLLRALEEKQQKQKMVSSSPKEQPKEPVKVESPKKSQADRQMQEEVQMLEIELDQEKRERALEKAQWKDEINRLRQELEQMRGDREVELQKYEQLQTKKDKLQEQNKHLKQLIEKISKEGGNRSNYRPKSQLNNHTDSRLTNEMLVKKFQQQKAIQSPQQFLPQSINPSDRFRQENKSSFGSKSRVKEGQIPKSLDFNQISEDNEEHENRELPEHDDTQLAQCSPYNPQQKEEEIHQAEAEANINRNSSNKSEPKAKETKVKKSSNQQQQIHKTNQTFPEALTDKKISESPQRYEQKAEPKEPKPKQQQAVEKEVSKEKEAEKKDVKEPQPPQEEQAKKIHHSLEKQSKGEQVRRYDYSEDEGDKSNHLKPRKRDRPGKHRKVIRLNY